MRNVHYTNQFKKDCKRINKQGKNTKELKQVIRKLSRGEKLERRYRDHKMIGNWNKHRECHIPPDWLLIYRINNDNLFLERTGSHSDFFK